MLLRVAFKLCNSEFRVRLIWSSKAVSFWGLQPMLCELGDLSSLTYGNPKVFQTLVTARNYFGHSSLVVLSLVVVVTIHICIHQYSCKVGRIRLRISRAFSSVPLFFLVFYSTNYACLGLTKIRTVWVPLPVLQPRNFHAKWSGNVRAHLLPFFQKSLKREKVYSVYWLYNSYFISCTTSSFSLWSYTAFYFVHIYFIYPSRLWTS